jgi:hypothetical protein
MCGRWVGRHPVAPDRSRSVGNGAFDGTVWSVRTSPLDPRQPPGTPRIDSDVSHRRTNGRREAARRGSRHPGVQFLTIS